MPLVQHSSSEPRGVRTLRVALIAGTVGSLIGGTIVVASVATVLSVINPSPKQTAALKSPPAVETTGTATPTDKTTASDDKNDCTSQTWPNIDHRCLRRADNPDQPTVLNTVAVKHEPATNVGIAPAQLQPGSPSVPASQALLQPQPIASAHQLPAPQTVQPPQPAAQAQPIAPPASVADVAPKAAPSNPVRKSERSRHPPKVVAHQDDDGTPPVVNRRANPRVEPDDIVIEQSPRRRFAVRQSADDDVVVERPRQPPSPLGIFGFLFGSNDD